MRIPGSIFLCFFLAFSFTTNAQISLGIKGGVDLSRLVNVVEGPDGSSNIAVMSGGTLTQIYGGAFVDIPLDSVRKMFYIRAGVEFVGAGSNLNATGDYYNGNGFQPGTKYSLHYVDVPVEFLYSPGFSWGRPWIGLGVYTGAVVSGTVKGPDGSSKPAMIGNSVTDNFQRFDFGYSFSIGMATKGGFQFGIDYLHGLVRVVPDATQPNGQIRLRTRNSVWGFNVGWIFRL
jgi:hypothetical protein